MGDPGRRSARLFWACVTIGVVQCPVVLLLVTGGSTVAEAGHAVSASVAASAIWWAAFSRYAEAEGRGFLDRQLKEQRAQLDNELDGHRELLVAGIEQVARRWRNVSLPRDIYPATNGFDRRFNRDLTHDLQRSSKYFFNGLTGIYVPARILLREEGSRPLEDVRLKVIDPFGDLAMEQAVAGRRRREAPSSKTDSEIRDEIVDDLYKTVIALWHARHQVRGPIKVWYENTSAIKRVEVFDDAVYDSTIDVDRSEDFPLTGCWAAGQPTYIQVDEEFDGPNQARAPLQITASTRKGELLQHLEKRGLDPARAEALWDAYHEEYVSLLEQRLPKALALNEIEPLEQQAPEEVLG